MKNTGNFHYAKEATTGTTKLAHFTVEWNTKKDSGKSMKNALYVLQYAKGHLSGRTVKKST